MDNLNIFWCNLKGLNNPNKRAACLDLISRHHVHIAKFQETHLTQKDVLRLENRFYKVAVSSSASNKTKGVVIMVHRKNNLCIIDSGGDYEGRVAFIKCSYNGQKIAFVNIHAPNLFDNDFFKYLNITIAHLSDFEIVIGSDMNTILNPQLDKSHAIDTNPRATKVLHHLLSDFDLKDAWRSFNPTSKDYTFFSSRHKSYSRIDFIFASSSLVSSFVDIKIVNMSQIIMHTGSLNISGLPKRANRWRFNIFFSGQQTEEFRLL